MANNKFPVIVAEQGKAPITVDVGSGATVRSAIKAFGLDPEKLSGSITLNGAMAELGDRVKRDDYLAVTPKVAGGLR